MYPSEYMQIEKVENIHFWYRGMAGMVIGILKDWIPDQDGYRSVTRQVRNDKRGEKIKILDAGCGTGGFTKKLEQYGDVYAVDINPTALKFAKRKKVKHLKKASVAALPFTNNYFELVLSLDVLYHKGVRNDSKALQEMYRVLKPHGILILRVPAFEFLRGNHDIVVETRHRYTKQEIKDKVLETGFKIEKLTYANMLLSIPLIFKRTFERFVKSESAASDTNLLPNPINDLFYRIIISEHRILNYIDLPFGSSVFCVARK